MHCFGHIHEGHGVQMATFHLETATVTDVEAVERESVLDIGTIAPAAADGEGMTLLVNAAIITHGEEENKKPWVVDMMF